jgi:hypothetical protein
MAAFFFALSQLFIPYRLNMWSCQLWLYNSPASDLNGLTCKIIGHAGVAYTLATCKQSDSYLGGNFVLGA